MSDDRGGLIDGNGGVSVIIKRPKKIIAVVCAIIVVIGFVAGVSVLITAGQKHHNENPSVQTNQKTSKEPSRHAATKWFCSSDITVPWIKDLCFNMQDIKYPCNDFYRYACGGWENHERVPNGKESWNRFLDTSKSIYTKIKHAFDVGIVVGSAEEKAKQFFTQCLSEDRSKRRQSLEKIRTFLRTIKGSSLTSLFSRGDITKIMAKVHEHGVWPLFRLEVRVHPKNLTKQILMLAPGSSPFSGEGVTDLTSGLMSVMARNDLTNRWSNLRRELLNLNPENLHLKKSEEYEKLDAWIREKQELLEDVDAAKLPLLSPRKNKAHDVWMNYRKEVIDGKEEESSMIDIHKDYNMLIFNTTWQVALQPVQCTIWDFGCTLSEAATLTNEMFGLEVDLLMALVKGKNKSVDNYGNKKEYKLMTIRQLKSECSVIDWHTYFSTITKRSISDRTEIMILDEANVLEVCKVLLNYTKADIFSNFDSGLGDLYPDLTYGHQGLDSKKRSLTNYLLVSLAKSLINSFDTYLLFDDYKEKFEQDYNTNHWYNCMARTNEAFGLATGSIYIRQVENKTKSEAIADVKQIVSYVKKAYKSKILTEKWLDKTTKTKAQNKIDAMIDKIGYPEEIINVTYRDDFYQKFDTDANGWFENLVSWKKFKVVKMINDVWRPFDRTKWSLTPATVNAEHAMIRNDMNLPISIFQLPFYSEDRPMVLNFGSLGTIIAHEMTHAFGKTGSLFDEYGRIDDWMTRHTEEILNSKSKCLIKQYEKFTIQGYKSNPNISIDEDIADNAGIRASYYAWQLWKEDHEDSFDNTTKLWMESEQLTEEMLFFISISQNYCEKYTSEGLKHLAKTHSPGHFRVKGSLMNTEFFQRAYSCPKNTKYVPDTRCRVW